MRLLEIDPDCQAIVILFTDNTALSFDLDPLLAVFPEMSRRKNGNWTPIKKWKAVRSSPSMAKW